MLAQTSTSEGPSHPEGARTTGALDSSSSATTIEWSDRDADHPYNMNSGRKWIIVIVISFSSLCVTCASSIYSTIYSQIMIEFHTSHELATLGLSFYIWGMGKISTSGIGISPRLTLAFYRRWSIGIRPTVRALW
ncbi:hypothetical protein QWA68_007127 [Fusarium oxysporum]|nr:hypothetical protein QWA68_007127 [Fusarium oxysporum]